MDDRKGVYFTRSIGLRVTGTLGVLEFAAMNGLTDLPLAIERRSACYRLTSGHANHHGERRGISAPLRTDQKCLYSACSVFLELRPLFPSEISQSPRPANFIQMKYLKFIEPPKIANVDRDELNNTVHIHTGGQPRIAHLHSLDVVCNEK
jgi:hypothetical protein